MRSCSRHKSYIDTKGIINLYYLSSDINNLTVKGRNIMNHFRVILYTLCYLWVVGVALPLPNDRSILQEVVWGPEINRAVVKADIILADNEVVEKQEKQKVVVVQSKDSNFVDPRQLYVDAVKRVYKVDLPYELADHVVKMAAMKGVSKDLLFAVIASESSFDNESKSHVGAVGYMQVWPKWHKERIAGRDINDPFVNIEVGADYLKECLEERGSLYEGLARYNGAKTRGEKDRYFNKIKHRSNLLVSAMNI